MKNGQDIQGAELFPRSVWSIRREALRAVVEHAKHVAAGGISADAIEAMRTAAPKAVSEIAPASGGKVAILPLQGVITPRGGFLSLLMGGTYGGLGGFRESFREAMSDEDVASILLVVDSPGGLVDLVPETAAEIFAARGTKKVVAIANTEASSAAYWIASQADELVVTPSGKVGSVGVFLRHEEISRMAEMEGVKITTIRAGKFKQEMNPYEPLTEEAEAHAQEVVDTIYDMFVESVSQGRDAKDADIRSGYGEGRVVLASQAVDLGLADRVATFEEVVAEMTGAELSGSGSGARAEDEPPVPSAEGEPKPTAEGNPPPPDPEPVPAGAQRSLADLLF